MADEAQKRFVRFDFPPGADPGEIAAAIEAMRAKFREERKARDEAQKAQDTSPTERPFDVTRTAPPAEDGPSHPMAGGG